MKIELSNGEIDCFADDIYKILRDVPLFYLNEIIELAHEGRKRDGEIEDLDVSESEEEVEEEVESSESESEEDMSSEDDS